MRLSHIEYRIEQQLILRQLIDKSVDNLIKVGYSNLTSLRIQTRLTALQENWDKFSLVHDAIGLAITKLSNADKFTIQQHSYFSDKFFEQTHESFLEASERMNSLLESETEACRRTTSTPSDSQNSNPPTYLHHARLPRIDLPKFNGSPSDWLSFKDLFSSLVLAHPTLTSVEKLQYLKTSLIGSASHLLKNTTLTADNFQKAWDALIQFYENKRLLVNSALHSLLTLRRMNRESASEMEQLYTNIMQIHRSLETLQRPVEYWDDFFVFIAVQRLDSDSVKAWEHTLGSSKEPPTWKQFSEFLITRLLSLQAFEKSRMGKHSQPPSFQPKFHFQGKAMDSNSRKTYSCSLCSSDHFTANCPRYKQKTVQQRLEIISKHKLCYNCLGTHRASCCKTTKRCQKCGHKHHTTIHQAKNSELKQSSDAPATSSKESHVLHSSSGPQVISPSVLLATAQVTVVSRSGESIKARDLIDQGSEISLISERLVQALRLPRKQSVISLMGIGAQSNTTRGITSFKIRPHFETDFELLVSAYILPKLTGSIPSMEIQESSWPHLQGFLLADENFTSPGAIDIILGAEIYAQIIEDGFAKGTADSPIGQRTELGWVISGPSGCKISSQKAHGYHVCLDAEFYDLLHRFWELEKIPSSNTSSQSPEDQECEKHFSSTHTRDEQGRYVVRLPFKHSAAKLGDSYLKAMRVMSSLNRKLDNASPSSKLYFEFMDEYERLNHIMRVTDSQPEPNITYYLPHHGVVRKNTLNTGLRVVFNGSSRTDSGYSLNDLLHTGTKLQSDLFDVLIWFRQFRYVFSSDIEKMFRQIKVYRDDWAFQRILWRDKKGTIVPYQLTTVTYGLACAPFLALRTLEQLITDEGHSFPLASPVLKKGRYVDDIFGGSDTIPQAPEIIKQLSQLCMAGGFPLRKWISNHLAVIKSIPQEIRIDTSIQIEGNTIVHTLGLCWNPSTDLFYFIINLPTDTVITKRTILSTIANLFDPLGLISPVIIKAKILIQELWAAKIEWDDPLPSTTALRWNQFIKHLDEMPNLSFPRWIHHHSDYNVELHGFCDASNQAIAAVIYLRSTGREGNTVSSLVCSKTKVAPLKKLTIPRLELSGAVLLTKLIAHFLSTCNLKDTPLYLWTDSAVTHTWINNHPSRWKDFVRNRVCFIQETLPQAIWKFVPGTENPADCASRGLTPAQLSQHPTWWTGPWWLSQDNSTWPQTLQPPSQKDNLEEKSSQASVLTCCKTITPWELLNRYSSLTRLLRITAWCQRAIFHFKRAPDAATGPLTPQELETAKTYWVRVTQRNSFHQEINLVSKGQPLPKSNPLVRLTPFMGSDGLLRIGGRLQSSSLPVTAQHPLILPRTSTFTSLVISNAHLRSMHGGTQCTTTFIRNEYWIVGGRTPIRSFILKCVKCARYRQQRAQQLMGQLPVERVIPSRPFLHSGVDYAGPLYLKTWKGRNARAYKAYIALFVCQATSAIHLELVTDYTTDGFIAAYKRFTTRRGICATMRSDCGTNLVGADSELRALFSSASKELGHLATILANDGTQWMFNPPAAPHFGGKWETGVKSVKFHLKRVIGDNLLTYEEMSTLLTQIEVVLNSRPLNSLSDDPDDLSVLTPGHFLIGSAITTIPEPSLELVKRSHLSRWQLIRQMLDCFWTRRSKECLQRYLAIHKWNRVNPSIAEGSLVLITDERYPPSKWPLVESFKRILVRTDSPEWYQFALNPLY